MGQSSAPLDSSTRAKGLALNRSLAKRNADSLLRHLPHYVWRSVIALMSIASDSDEAHKHMPQNVAGSRRLPP